MKVLLLSPYSEKLIPVIITNALRGSDLPIYGSGNNVRDWLYVEDHITAIKQVLDRGVIGETYCIGGNNEFSNIQIAKIICEKLDLIRSKNKSYLDQIVFTEDRKGHDFRYAINNNKIKNNLNWEPNESFETGINKTIDWFLEYYKL